VRKNLGFRLVLIGLTLTALSLTGSIQYSAISPSPKEAPLSDEVRALNEKGRALSSAGNFSEARHFFVSAATEAAKLSDSRSAAMNWSNAGACDLAAFNFRGALESFIRARQIAEVAREPGPLANTLNNLATLYLQMGNPAAALQMANEALAIPVALPTAGLRPKLQLQVATALSRLHRFPEARPIYRTAIDELYDSGDLGTAAHALGSLGTEAFEAGSAEEADAALTAAVHLVRVHRLKASTNIFRELAKVRASLGQSRLAASLYATAIAETQSFTPRWVLYADRGDFRLGQNDLTGALSDFREARALASALRADMVPADQDRVTVENELSRAASGFVEAGNRLAIQSQDSRLIHETFDAAEQDRIWALNALMPEADDWRSRLPASYWNALAQYRQAECSYLAQPSAALRQKADSLGIRLQEIEATAGGKKEDGTAPSSAFEHAVAMLDDDSVLLSFHLAAGAGWLWAVDRTGAQVVALKFPGDLNSEIKRFTEAVRAAAPEARPLGASLYAKLFGDLPERFRLRKRWLLELDGPLFDLPFAALVVSEAASGPVYLVERARLEAIPGALLLEKQRSAGDERFLGIGDAIYNVADARYRGVRTTGSAMLPRLQSTGAEVRACSRAWGANRARLLTGDQADVASVEAALKTNPSVIHFATHVVPGPGDFSSGMIALSLDQGGAMGLLGPRDIVAHPVNAALVVLNGCHSAQGDAVPGGSLMGLTRAWIAAGAGAVIATRWDIPDDASQEFMTIFYSELRAHWNDGPSAALQKAQLTVLRKSKSNLPALVGAYFLLGRA
jgi:CHAT domain-containing protein/Tfp pilus assembly protein PilF